ncbi:MAG: flagellar hook assembly protein FlgD [Cellvibrionaceae bacterium]
MSDLSSVNNAINGANINDSASALDHLNITKKNEEETKSNELGQTAFLELMIAQLSNQDPLKPQENGEFIAQLAQFSSVEGIERLNSNFEGFTSNFTSNRALEASSLVGRSVTVPGDTTYLLDGQLTSATAEIPSTTTDLSVNIYTESGELVQQFPVGFHAAGDASMRWDGLNLEVDGEIVTSTGGRTTPLPSGEYRFEITATQSGETQELATAVSANVNSVSVEANGNITLNLAGIGPINLTDVKQFN